MENRRPQTFGIRSRVTRREFAACVALGGAAVAATASSHAPAFESHRFTSREELENAVRAMRKQFPDALLLDAVSAPHVPELLVVRGVALPEAAAVGFYEVRRFRESPSVLAQPSARRTADLKLESGLIQITGYRSLSERAADWRAYDSSLQEIGVYRAL